MSNAVDKATAQANLRRVVISSLMGAVIEWYDFFGSSGFSVGNPCQELAG